MCFFFILTSNIWLFGAFVIVKQQIDASFLSSVLLLMIKRHHNIVKVLWIHEPQASKASIWRQFVNYWQACISWKRGPIQLPLRVVYYCWNPIQSWIRDSMPLIAYSKYCISVELGFWIPVVSGILDSLSCIPDSKAQDYGLRIPPSKISWIPKKLDVWIKVAPKAKFPAGLGGKNGWAVPGVCIEPVDEKLTWIPHMLELKKPFVKKLDLLKKSKFLPRSVRHFSLSDLWSYTMVFFLQLWLISVSGTASLQGCETYFWFTLSPLKCDTRPNGPTYVL